MGGIGNPHNTQKSDQLTGGPVECHSKQPHLGRPRTLSPTREDDPEMTHLRAPTLYPTRARPHPTANLRKHVKFARRAALRAALSAQPLLIWHAQLGILF